MMATIAIIGGNGLPSMPSLMATIAIIDGNGLGVRLRYARRTEDVRVGKVHRHGRLSQSERASPRITLRLPEVRPKRILHVGRHIFRAAPAQLTQGLLQVCHFAAQGRADRFRLVHANVLGVLLNDD